jgi:hypothetical protein
MVALSVLFTARTVVSTAATLHAPCFLLVAAMKAAAQAPANCVPQLRSHRIQMDLRSSWRYHASGQAEALDDNVAPAAVTRE